jgi:carboxylesterase type B
MVFVPTIDGDLIPEHPLAAVRRGAAAGLPLLVGTTLDEWKLFSPIELGARALGRRALVERMEQLLPSIAARAPAADRAAWQYQEAVRARGGRTSPFEVWAAFQSARVFHYPASLLSEAQSSARGTAFSYLFTWRPPALRRTVGACHALDVPFIFGLAHSPVTRTLAGLGGSATRLSRRMQHAWIHFARTRDTHAFPTGRATTRRAGRPWSSAGNATWPMRRWSPNAPCGSAGPERGLEGRRPQPLCSSRAQRVNAVGPPARGGSEERSTPAGLLGNGLNWRQPPADD